MSLVERQQNHSEILHHLCLSEKLFFLEVGSQTDLTLRLVRDNVVHIGLGSERFSYLLYKRMTESLVSLRLQFYCKLLTFTL